MALQQSKKRPRATTSSVASKWGRCGPVARCEAVPNDDAWEAGIGALVTQSEGLLDRLSGPVRDQDVAVANAGSHSVRPVAGEAQSMDGSHDWQHELPPVEEVADEEVQASNTAQRDATEPSSDSYSDADSDSSSEVESEVVRPLRLEEHLPEGMIRPMREFSAEYALGDEVGRGASGIVFEATALQGEFARVAVKAIDIRRWRLSCVRPDRLCQEVEVLHRTAHPNVLRLHKVYQDDHQVYLVTDFVHGTELFNVIVEHGPLAEREAKPLMRQVLLALQYLHGELAVIHRDVKPANIMVATAKAHATLVDFGFARFLGADAVANSCVGTRYFRAPEVERLSRACADTCPEEGSGSSSNGCSSSNGYSFAADLYSFGATMYAALTATYCQPRFVHGQGGQVSTELNNKECRHLTVAAKSLIVNLLSHNPDERYDATTALSHRWLCKNYGRPDTE